MQEIGMQTARWQEDVQRFDASAGRLLGLNETDRRCGFLLTQSSLTAKELAEAIGLTPGAVTTVIDRLEDAGFVRRRRDQTDRRRVQVELTPQAHRRFEEIWGPLVKEGMEMLSGYATAELQLVHGFVEKLGHLQRAHTARLECRTFQVSKPKTNRKPG